MYEFFKEKTILFKVNEKIDKLFQRLKVVVESQLINIIIVEFLRLTAERISK